MSDPSDSIDRRTLLAAAATGGTLASAGSATVLGAGNDDPGAGEAAQAGGADGDDADDETGATFDVETVADGFANPWGMAFLPDGNELLVTERKGRLNRVGLDDGSVDVIEGTPDVHASGQGGLLDVTLHPEYPDVEWVYLTYAGADDDGASATHLGRGRLEPGDDLLADFEILHVAAPFVESNAHYGSRVVFRDGDLYVTSGDRGFKDFGPEHTSQDTTTEHGATLRLAPDGAVPADNPFVDDEGVRDAIYSYGHRNAQGMTVHPETGDLWQSEHGERDGDELNVVEAGGNYGWPLAHYGCAYGTDDPVGIESHEREDLVDPVYHWECGTGGFPPAGMTFYDGEAFDAWHGDLFVGNLASEYLGRFAVDGRDVRELNPLLEGRGWRIRDVAVAPDTGYLYVAVDAADAPIVRLVPV